MIVESTNMDTTEEKSELPVISQPEKTVPVDAVGPESVTFDSTVDSVAYDKNKKQKTDNAPYLHSTADDDDCCLACTFCTGYSCCLCCDDNDGGGNDGCCDGCDGCCDGDCGGCDCDCSF